MISEFNKTQIENAYLNKVTTEMRQVALDEGISQAEILKKVADGRVVLLVNNRPHVRPIGIGEGLRVKVNANIGTSEFCSGIGNELKKLKVAIEAGADTVMDLSTGGDLRKILREIIKNSSVPVGTVPIYQCASIIKNKNKSLKEITPDLIFDVIEDQAQAGVSFVTVHCGVTLKILKILKNFPRKMGVVSRGGAILLEWMKKNKKENPLLEDFDRLLKIAKKFDLVLSLGDGLRPGCLEDAGDRAQIEELKTLAKLAKIARKNGVMTMIEGPGHVPLDKIEENIKLQKKLCNNAPFYVLGPLVTDIALGYDHIAGAIGGAIAGLAGADFLCYVTPSEHLALPDVDDVREGVIASKISAHAVDIARGNLKAIEKDKKMARARRRFEWEKQIKYALFSKKPAEIYRRRGLKGKKFCSMCGDLCAIKIFNKL